MLFPAILMIITSSPEAGAPLGVQWLLVVHEPPDALFHFLEAEKTDSLQNVIMKQNKRVKSWSLT